ncbi:MAG: IPT/TIG domain-containing protein, partial [Terracidiphilus sp.]
MDPTVTSISPTSVAAGSGPLTLTVNGTGYTSSTTVQVGGVADQSTFVSSTQLTATVPAAQLENGGQLAVIAVNGAASSGSGAAVNLQVTNPAPVISSVSPSVEQVNASSLSITVTGTGFVPSTVIQINGGNRTTSYASSTQVSVALTTADVASSGTLSLTAVNPQPGGGTSTAALVAVNNPVPGAGRLSTNTVLSSAAAPVTITVTGTNYVPNSTVQLNGTVRTTTYVSSTQLTFQLTSADLTTAQEFAVSVTNPAPGGGSAPAGNLFVLLSTTAPVITQVSPAQLIAGSGATNITVYGSNLYEMIGTNTYFVTTTVLWNGTPLTGGFVQIGSNPAITATVPASLLTSTGTANITVSSIASTPA